MKKFALYALSLAALLAACKKDDNKPQPPAQEDKQTLEVQVYNTLNWSIDNPAGTLAAGATVLLFKTKADFNSGTAAYTEVTAGTGTATFASIDTGWYFIAARTTELDNLLGATQQNGVTVGYKADSLYQTDEEIAASPFNAHAAPGNFRLEDLNMDGIVNTSDMTELPAQSIHIAANTSNSKRILIGKVENH